MSPSEFAPDKVLRDVPEVVEEEAEGTPGRDLEGIGKQNTAYFKQVQDRSRARNLTANRTEHSNLEGSGQLEPM